MEKRKLLLTTAVAAATLALASPSMAKVEPSASTQHIQSLSGMAVTVDAFGRPTVDGFNIAAKVSVKVKPITRIAAGDKCVNVYKCSPA